MSHAGLASAIAAATGQGFEAARATAVGGGCINRGLVLEGRDGRRFFAKLNDARHAEMFAAEAEGLRELEAAAAIRVPRAITHGVAGAEAYLVLEWLPLGGMGSGAELGRRLAALHRVSAHSHGWRRDNTIGATPQHNAPNSDWLAFFREHRLGFQLRLARERQAPGDLIDLGERLLADMHVFFAAHRPTPSLLHGDLWGGNYGYAEGEPVLFDPAVYFGDRETDLAMTELFGGFPTDFRAAYREAWPLDAGYATRRTLYNLYHVLNHFNLFGGPYAGQARAMMAGLLAETR